MQRSLAKILLGCFLTTALMMVFFGMYPLNPSCNCDCTEKQRTEAQKTVGTSNAAAADDDELGVHKLCVLVPFRDRLEELLEFAPHIHSFLNRQGIRHTIYVVNQVDQLRFNRASLINAGFLESRGSCDYVAMHDVDLLPLNDALPYAYPDRGPFHVAAPELHPRYHYKTFVGGILLLRRDHFQKVNGLSNKYWGWGLEDDEFFVRLRVAGLNVTRPANVTTGPQDTFLHLHDRKRRQRDMAKLYNQKEVTRRRDRATGLNTVRYRLLKRYHIAIDGAPVTMMNVELACDRAQTPWCDHGVRPASSTAAKPTPTTVEQRKFHHREPV